MTLLLIGLIATMLLELILYTIPSLWQHTRFRRGAASLIAIALGVLAGALVAYRPHVSTIILAIITAYRVIHLLRITENRSNERHLHRVAARSGTVLAGFQVAVLIAWGALTIWPVQADYVYAAVGVVALIAAAVLFTSTLRRMKKTKLTEQMLLAKTTELPSVTVAIPARNETIDLEECLQSVIASDYPKLEILVLDDCSQNRRTPEIIRSFAHAGVRFVKGEMPRDYWLAKNQAYDQLTTQANGEIMLYCGVDVRFGKDTIRSIVSTMVYKKKRMISLLPLRVAGPRRLEASLLQAARYFWELAPPRKLFRRPAVLSSAWAIYRKDVIKHGGFKAVSRAVLPEAYFAKASTVNDGYSFMRANEDLELLSAKSYTAQKSTAIRTRYPQLHRRPETVLVVSAAGVLCFVAPFVLTAAGLLGYVSFMATLCSILAASILTVTFMIIAIASRTTSSYLSVVAFLPMVLADIVMMHTSMWKYEFSEVIWKGRNICVPVMHVLPHLPSLSKPAKKRATNLGNLS